MFSKILKLLNTLKYLRFEQIFFRIVYRFKKISVLPIREKIKTKSWQWNGPRIYKQSLFKDNKVRFLSSNGRIDSPASWNCDRKDKLWLYNLHYFDDLNSSTFKERTDLQAIFFDKWIDENPPCLGNGWEPYPLSLRIVNLVKWLSCHPKVKMHWLNSLMQQASALSQQIEYHISGNHLFANAKALIFVGTYINNDEAQRYFELGLKLLDREIPEQFLDDGAHFELSPMYHVILLWDLLELFDLAKTCNNKILIERTSNWKTVAQKSLHWLSNMQHPDGEISFFNDSSLGIAAEPAKVFEYATNLGLQWRQTETALETLSDSGYTRINKGNYTMIFDHANVGPDYLPGHSHADTLSFEISIDKQRVFINSGTSIYGLSDERIRQRKTPAHNTVSIESHDSSQVWSGFRVAKRAYSKLEKAKIENNKVILVASHDGFLKQAPKTRHKRQLECGNKNIVIDDILSKKVNACFHLHVHPDVVVKRQSNNLVKFSVRGKFICTLESSLPLDIVDSTWHPEFGKSIQNKKIKIPFSNGTLKTTIHLNSDPQ